GARRAWRAGEGPALSARRKGHRHRARRAGPGSAHRGGAALAAGLQRCRSGEAGVGGNHLDHADGGRELIMARAEVQRLIERMAIPAIAAPMFLVSNPALTLACCAEGIMGSFPAHGTRSREQFQAWLDEMVAGTRRLEDQGRKLAPWAVNLVVHASNPPYAGDPELVEKYKVPVVLT